MTALIALPFVGLLIGLLVVTMGGGGGSLLRRHPDSRLQRLACDSGGLLARDHHPDHGHGSLQPLQGRQCQPPIGLLMLAGGVVGAVLGSLASPLIPAGVYTKLIGAIMLALTLRMVVSQIASRASRRKGRPAKAGPGRGALLAALGFGLIGGITSGLAGLSGGGPIVVGLGILGCGVLEMVGTSVFVLAGISTAGFLAHLGLGGVDWKLVLLLLLGTMSGAAIGPMLLKRIDKQALERAMGPVMLVMMVGMSAALLLR